MEKALVGKVAWNHPPSMNLGIVNTILSPVHVTISYMVFANLTALHRKCNYC